MLASKEIRWFTEVENKKITAWFFSKDCSFDKIEPRTDYYKILNQDNLSIKLREGNIEVKERTAESEKKQMGKNANGIFENWAKWSFNVKPEDLESKSIISDGDAEWIEVVKYRIGLKVKLGEDNQYQFLPISHRLDYGCQIEYTKIQIRNKIWFTFGLEWFGDKFIEITQSLIEEITGNTLLNSVESFGYSEFLKQFKTAKS